jgi:hypothetical protein
MVLDSLSPLVAPTTLAFLSSVGPSLPPASAASSESFGRRNLAFFRLFRMLNPSDFSSSSLDDELELDESVSPMPTFSRSLCVKPRLTAFFTLAACADGGQI